MRSLIFWFGLFSLGFLGWAWSSSTHTSTVIAYSQPDRRLAIANSHATVRVVFDTAKSTRAFTGGFEAVHRDRRFPNFLYYPGIPGFDAAGILNAAGGLNTARFPPPGHQLRIWGEYRRECWAVPHWLLIALGLPLWLALLAWRSRRRARAVRAPAAPPGAGE